MENDLERKGKWNKFDYEELMLIRSLTSKRILAGQTNETRGVDVELDIERIQDFNKGIKKRAKSLVAVSVSIFLLIVAAFILNMASERYSSINKYRDWVVWCIPCLTACYMIYLKDFQIGGHWKDFYRSTKVVWWTIFVINLFSLVFNSFNLMGW